MKITDKMSAAKDNAFRTVLENKFTLCVHDFAPVCPGHCVVLPKRSVQHLQELTDQEAKSLLEIAEKVSTAIEKSTGKSCIIVKNMGDKITYSDTLHFHILPSEYKIGEMYASLHDHEVPHIQRKRDVTSKETLTQYTDRIKKHL